MNLTGTSTILRLPVDPAVRFLLAKWSGTAGAGFLLLSRHVRDQPADVLDFARPRHGNHGDQLCSPSPVLPGRFRQRDHHRQALLGAGRPDDGDHLRHQRRADDDRRRRGPDGRRPPGPAEKVSAPAPRVRQADRSVRRPTISSARRRRPSAWRWPRGGRILDFRDPHWMDRWKDKRWIGFNECCA